MVWAVLLPNAEKVEMPLPDVHPQVSRRFSSQTTPSYDTRVSNRRCRYYDYSCFQSC